MCRDWAVHELPEAIKLVRVIPYRFRGGFVRPGTYSFLGDGMVFKANFKLRALQPVSSAQAWVGGASGGAGGAGGSCLSQGQKQDQSSLQPAGVVGDFR